MKIRNIILFIVVILWGIVIFYASSRNSSESNSSSKLVLKNCIEEIVKITNKLSFTKIDVSNPANINKIVNKLNAPFRKFAHGFVYFVFAIVIGLFLLDKTKSLHYVFLVTIGICFLYSLSDEFHQTFVMGRSGQFRDCMIDTFGSFLGCWVVYFIAKIKRKRHKKVLE